MLIFCIINIKVNTNKKLTGEDDDFNIDVLFLIFMAKNLYLKKFPNYLIDWF